MIQILPICKGCGQRIVGSCITALGATWHPEHFVCAGCGQPLTDEWSILYEGALYHITCHEQRFVPRCAYCGKPMRKWLLDQWGACFCPEHQHEYPTCVYCGRLISPQQQEVEREPGAVMRCPICRASAIETVEAARPLFTQVKQWVGSRGLVYNNLPLSLELCGPARFASLSQVHVQGHIHGTTDMVIHMQNGRRIYTEIKGVAVLRGLPAMLFQGVTVHELGHVWLAVHGVGELPLWAEEGFCRLLSYYWYNEANTPESRFYARKIERSVDTVYGEGFKRVHALSNTVGFAHLLETLQRQKRLPDLHS